MASPGAAGLFHKAIVQSSAYELVLPNLNTAEAQGASFASNVGCSGQTVRCLRSLTAQQILAYPIFVSPVIDGFTLPLDLQIAAATGQFNRVPIINGSNRDEARFMIAMDELAGKVVTADKYPAEVVAVFGPLVGPLVLAQYPLISYANAQKALAAIQTDSSFACPVRLADRALSFYVPVFAYEFNDEKAPEIFLPPVSFPYGAAHGSELQYLFVAEDLTHLPRHPEQLSASQQNLSEMMIRYWTQFAKEGNPNGPLTPAWPEYKESEIFQSLVPLSIAAEAGSTFASNHHCDFWAELVQQ
jgi:para-nitrobenzyl esterase